MPRRKAILLTSSFPKKGKRKGSAIIKRTNDVIIKPWNLGTFVHWFNIKNNRFWCIAEILCQKVQKFRTTYVTTQFHVRVDVLLYHTANIYKLAHFFYSHKFLYDQKWQYSRNSLFNKSYIFKETQARCQTESWKGSLNWFYHGSTPLYKSTTRRNSHSIIKAS